MGKLNKKQWKMLRLTNLINIAIKLSELNEKEVRQVFNSNIECLKVSNGTTKRYKQYDMGINKP